MSSYTDIRNALLLDSLSNLMADVLQISPSKADRSDNWSFSLDFLWCTIWTGIYEKSASCRRSEYDFEYRTTAESASYFVRYISDSYK